MAAVFRDLRQAARGLAASPGFTATVAATLGLAVAGNAAIFSFLDQVVLRPLPVREPERLVLLHTPGPYSGHTSTNKRSPVPMSHPMYVDFRDRSPVFEGVAAYFPTGVHLEDAGSTEAVDADLVSGTYFPVLGLAPAAGRLLQPSDDVTPGAHPVAVLSHGYWTRRFAADAGVVGRRVRINDEPMTLVGVAPQGFGGLEVGRAADVFVPVAMKARMTPTWDGLADRRSRWLTVVARLAPGADVDSATAGANVLYRQILRQEVQELADSSESLRARFVAKTLELLPGSRGASGFREGAQQPLLVLMGMVTAVLLIACANVANLLVIRGASRRRELAIRQALGAGRGRLVGELLAESVLLGLMGAAVGLVLSPWAGRLLLGTLPSDGAPALSPDPDLRVAAFTLVVGLGSVLVFGLAPALGSTRTGPLSALREGSVSVAGGPRSARLRRTLVTAQVALSLLLLAVAGLFTRTLANLRALDPGFDPEHLIAFQVSPALSGYDDDGSRGLFRALVERLEALPGVRAVSFAREPLLADSVSSSTVRVDGYESTEGEDMNPHVNVVGSAFFSTLGIPLASGRAFDERDVAGAPAVAAVNETFARYFFKGESAVGRRFRFRRRGEASLEIVAVVGDSKAANLRDEVPRHVYLPVGQASGLDGVTFYVRARGPIDGLVAGLRAAVAEVDRGLPVEGLKTMRAQIDQSLGSERSVAALSGAFGGLATLLAGLGLYGVVSHGVGQRTREIGLRIALGAGRRQVAALVLGEGARLVLVGTGLGLLAALAVGRSLSGLLYGLSPTDPTTLAATALALGGVALVAAAVPARRAARIEPAVALREG